MQVVFKAPRVLGDRFSFKNRPKDIEKQSLVVYHIRCKGGTDSEGRRIECNEDYIGKTERILHFRLREHRGEASASNESAVHKHQEETGHEIDFENVEILDRADNDFKLQYKELMHIDKRKPTLNQQLNKQDSYRINTYIIGSKKKL